MEQQFNNDQKQFLRALLSNPESSVQGYAQDLERLVNQYPHSGVLHALLAYAGEEKNLKRASLYFAPASLYKLINSPSALAEVPDSRIIKQGSIDQAVIHPEIPNRHEDKTAGDHIDDETYEEIVGIEDIDTNAGAGTVAADRENEPVKHDIETDFFKFDEPLNENEAGEPVPVNDPAATQQEISKYNDDKMPYTFMWWLDKTRREHAGISQPYVKPETGGADIVADTGELQQQYYENIFHISSLEELEKKPTPQFSTAGGKRKEDMIIERFIQEEPQIKPQSSDKLDAENKAKKSAEDHDELVTETLAAIYTDQMLYHKAIASYKKLMLKFPEKSRYFADKIEQLEKRTN